MGTLVSSRQAWENKENEMFTPVEQLQMLFQKYDEVASPLPPDDLVNRCYRAMSLVWSQFSSEEADFGGRVFLRAAKGCCRMEDSPERIKESARNYVSSFELVKDAVKLSMSLGRIGQVMKELSQAQAVFLRDLDKEIDKGDFKKRLQIVMPPKQPA
jgi:hypothetical protein